MNLLLPPQIVSTCAQSGKIKASLPIGKAFVLAIMAGIWISIGGAATSTAVYTMDNPGLSRLVTGLIFPFGLAMVILLGNELFTGNCLMVISLFERRISFSAMLKSWGIVFLGNWVGTTLLAASCAFFGQLGQSNGALAVYAIKLATAKCTIPFWNALVMGILCNLLVCAAVLMASAATDVTGKILGCYLPVAFFVISGFEHVIANMYYITIGLFANMNPTYAALAIDAGVNTQALTWSGFLFGNLLPVTIGNIIGGTGIGIMLWFGRRESTAD